RIRKPSREVLTIGRRLAGASGGDLLAFAAGSGAADAASDAGAFGAKKLYAVADAKLDVYTTELFAAALKQVVDDVQPGVLLFGGTSNGRDLAPRLAARLNAGVASDVDRLEWTDGKLRARRPVYSGKAFATVEISSTPAIATTRINAFPAEESGGAATEIVEVSAPSDSKTN